LTVNPLFLWFLVFVLVITAAGLVLSREWRLNIGFLALQYLAVFLLILAHWEFPLAAIKLLAGWMSALTLGMTRVDKEDVSPEASLPQGWLFRAFAVGLALVAVLAIAQGMSVAFPSLPLSQLLAAALLMVMGLLQLGLTVQPLRVTLGLLTFLSGFEILYALAENAILVTGMLALITLGIALGGAYLILLNDQKTEEA